MNVKICSQMALIPAFNLLKITKNEIDINYLTSKIQQQKYHFSNYFLRHNTKCYSYFFNQKKESK